MIHLAAVIIIAWAAFILFSLAPRFFIYTSLVLFFATMLYLGVH